MSNLFFYIVLTLILTSYATQLNKIYKNKSSTGISLQAYIITFIAITLLTFNADSKEVFYIGFLEMILSLFGILLIYYFKNEEEKISKIFIVALTGSFFMIHGIMQGIKSFQHKGKSTISISSYLIWIAMDLMIIYLATDIKIIIALLISILIYVYIIIDTIFKNKLYILSYDR